jgi:hypothetical protein
MPDPVMPEMKVEDTPELPKSEQVVEVVKEEMKVEPEVKEEVKSVEDAPKKVDEEVMPEGKQNIIQQVQQQVTNALSNVPIVGPLLNRNTQPPNDEVATTVASDTPQEASADATTAPNRPILNAIQGLTNQVQTALGITPVQSDTPQDTQQPAGPLGAIQGAITNFQNSLQTGFQGAVSTLTNVFRPPGAASTPTKTEDKPAEETTVVEEEQKSSDEPTVDVQKEENKIEDEETKEKISQE